MATKIETKLKRRGDNLRVCLVSGFDFIQTFVCLFRKGIPNFGGLVFKLWGLACIGAQVEKSRVSENFSG